MTIRYIVIAYDDNTAAEGEPYDLQTFLRNELDNAHIRTTMSCSGVDGCTALEALEDCSQAVREGALEDEEPSPTSHIALLDSALGMLTNFEDFDAQEKPEGFDDLMAQLRTTIERRSHP